MRKAPSSPSEMAGSSPAMTRKGDETTARVGPCRPVSSHLWSADAVWQPNFGPDLPCPGPALHLRLSGRSGADIFVRFYAEKLRPVVGRPIIVENKPGAVSNIATEYVARSKPDGYTVYIQGASSIAANMHLFKNPPVDVGKAIQIAAPLNRQPYMLVVDAGRPWKTVGELTAYLKENKD